MERTKMPKCKCGCGKVVSRLGYRYIRGHNLRHISSESEQKRREKISITRLKFFENPEEIEKCRIRSTGRHHTEETKQLLSTLRTGEGNGMFGKHHTEEANQKRSQKLIGHLSWNKGLTKETDKRVKSNPTSKEQKIQISKTLKEYYKYNEGTFKNKHHTEEAKEKNRQWHLGRFRGEKASNWQGGIDSFPYAKEWTPWLIEEIKTRDNYTCQNPECKDPHIMLDVHHINYDKTNSSPLNLITICKKCHGKTQKNREYWVLYYQKIINERQIQPRFIRTKFY